MLFTLRPNMIRANGKILYSRHSRLAEARSLVLALRARRLESSIAMEFYFQTHFDKGSSTVCFPFRLSPHTFESNKKALF
jgi:hypothetical protein